MMVLNQIKFNSIDLLHNYRDISQPDFLMYTVTASCVRLNHACMEDLEVITVALLLQDKTYNSYI